MALMEWTVRLSVGVKAAFDEHGSPDAGPHKEAHAALLERARSLKEQHDAGATMMSLEVIEFLKDWVTDHIKGEDKKHSAFFAER